MAHPANRIQSRIAVIALVIAACFGIAACGGDDDSGGGNSQATVAPEQTPDPAPEQAAEAASDGLEKHREAVEKAMAPQTEWLGPREGPATKSGKRILNASCGEAAEGCVRITRGVTEAARTAGWSSKLIDTAGDPTKLNDALVRELTSGRWDGLAIAAVDPNLLQSAVAEATKRKVPIVSANYKSEPPYPEALLSSVTGSNCDMGYAIGSAIVLARNGEAKVAVFRDTEFPGVEEEVNCIVKAIKDAPDSEVVADQNFKVTELATAVPSATTSLLRREGEGVNFVAAGYDAMTDFVIQGVRQSGRKDINVSGYTANAKNLKEMSEGSPLQTVNGAMVGEWMGYGMVDQLNRAFNGVEKFKDDEGIRPKLITTENLEPSWVKDGYQAQGEIDFRACFEELWKSGKTECHPAK